jgi:hypothetical protein
MCQVTFGEGSRYWVGVADMICDMALRSTAAPEARPVVAYGVRTSNGTLHSLTVTKELAERNAAQLNQTVVPLLDGSLPPQRGSS